MRFSLLKFQIPFSSAHLSRRSCACEGLRSVLRHDRLATGEDRERDLSRYTPRVWLEWYTKLKLRFKPLKDHRLQLKIVCLS
jgi:hypothetical protein